MTYKAVVCPGLPHHRKLLYQNIPAVRTSKFVFSASDLLAKKIEKSREKKAVTRQQVEKEPVGREGPEKKRSVLSLKDRELHG